MSGKLIKKTVQEFQMYHANAASAMRRKKQLEQNPEVLKKVQIFNNQKELAKAQSKWSDKYYEYALYKAVSKK